MDPTTVKKMDATKATARDDGKEPPPKPPDAFRANDTSQPVIATVSHLGVYGQPLPIPVFTTESHPPSHSPKAGEERQPTSHAAQLMTYSQLPAQSTGYRQTLPLMNPGQRQQLPPQQRPSSAYLPQQQMSFQQPPTTQEQWLQAQLQDLQRQLATLQLQQPHHPSQVTQPQPQQGYGTPQQDYVPVTYGIITPWNDTFEGKSSEDIHGFFKTFEHYCKLSRVSPDMRVSQLWLKLGSYPQQLVGDIDDNDIDAYSRMRDRLLTTFGGADQTHAAKLAIEDLKYGNSTTYNDFVGRLMIHLKKAYPKDTNDTREARAFDLIMAKLPDEMRHEMLRYEATTLADLNRKAPVIEVLMRDMHKTNSLKHLATQVNDTHLPHGQPDVGQTLRPNATYPPTDQANGVQWQLPNTYDEVINFQTEVEEAPPVTCGFCGKQGHVMMHCRTFHRYGPVNSDSTRPQRASTFIQIGPRHRPRKCYACGEYGHMAQGCDYAKREEKPQPHQSVSVPQIIYVHPPAMQTQQQVTQQGQPQPQQPPQHQVHSVGALH